MTKTNKNLSKPRAVRANRVARGTQTGDCAGLPPGVAWAAKPGPSVAVWGTNHVNRREW